MPLFTKVYIFLLYLNGIVVDGTRCHRLTCAIIFHVILIICLVRPLACIIQCSEHLDFYSGILLNLMLSTILWWTLFLRKNELLNIFTKLSLEKSNEKHTKKKMLLIIFITIFLFPPFAIDIDLIKYWEIPNVDISGRLSCRSLWLPRGNEYFAVLLLIIDVAKMHISYSLSFTIFMIFCLYCILTLKRLHNVIKVIPLRNSEFVRIKVNHFISVTSKIEKNLSFPLFLLICKICVDIFNAISVFLTPGRGNSAKKMLILSTPHITIWFISVVVFGDLVQRKCLKLLAINFDCLKAKSEVQLRYFDYKRMKEAMTLTAWKMFRIDRSLLMTAFASIITYGIIISQLKND